MALNPPHRSSAAGTHAHVDPYPDEYLVHNYPLMAVGGSAPLLRLLRSDPAAPPELSGPVATAPAPVPAEAPPPPAAAALADAPPDHRQLPAAAATAAVQLPQQPAQAVLHGPDAGPPLATHRSAPSLPAHGARVSFYQTLLHLLTVRAARMTDLPKESPMIFKVVVLDQLFQLPPRKPRNPQPGQVHLHSRLSPKNPQSLLYPDGLMLPQWVTRHREQIPSVYVGFYELAEHVPQSPQPASPVVRGPLDSGRDAPAAVGAAERQWDQALVAEINDHKRQLIDRQIKFAAVLVLSPAQEADPLVTEERVAYVRRTAGLEAKNSFFLLAQSNTDLLEFVTNLHKSLFEHAVGYYREHGKRVKRKRAKLWSLKDSPAPPSARLHHAPLPSSASADSLDGAGAPPTPAAGAPGPTMAERWTFRYDFKAAFFAEFRQDYEAAIKHLESAYVHVVDMLQPTSLLSHGATGYRVRSQRWKEAWLLADSVNFKVIKLFLLVENPIPAVTQLRKHIAIFEELWGKWRLGQTFEYWAWLSRQYHTFAAVLEQVVSIGLRLPQPPFTGINYGLLSGHQASAADFRFAASLVGSSNNPGTGNSGGVNPMLVLQHPGFYYHSAATCATKRWRSFVEVEAAYKRATASGLGTGDEAARKILDEESRVDHATAVINLLTKAYEHFRLQRAGRMTLFLASEIAETHFAGRKYDVALKFFERIAKTYRKEGWSAILVAVLFKSLACARELRSWPAMCEYALEVVSDRSSLSKRERETVLRDLFDVLREPPTELQPDEKKGTEEVPSKPTSEGLISLEHQQTQNQKQADPSAPDAAVASAQVAEPAADSEPIRPLKRRSFLMDVDQVRTILTFNVQFRNTSAYVGSSCPWQITITTGVDSPAVPLRFSALRVGFSDPKLNHVLTDPLAAPEAGGAGPIQDDPGLEAPRFRGRRGREWVDCRECCRSETGEWTAEVDLVVRPECRKVFEGKVIAPADCQELKIVQLSAVLSTSYWDVILTSKIGEKPVDNRRPRRWLERPTEVGAIPRFVILDGTGERSSIPILNVEPKLEVSVSHASPAMLDELYAVHLTMRNNEKDPVEVQLKADVRRGDKPDKGDGVFALNANAAEIDAVADVPLGSIPPGGVLDRTVYMRCGDVLGERILTLLIRYELKSASPPGGQSHTFEKKRVLHIPIVQAFEPTFEVNPLCSGDLITGVDPGDGPIVALPDGAGLVEHVLLVCGLKSTAPWELEVAEIRLHLAAGETTAITELTSTEAGEMKGDYTWLAGDVHRSTYQLRAKFADRGFPRPPFEVGRIMVKWRRKLAAKDSEPGARPYSSSWVPVPRVDLGHRETVAVADVPPQAFQGEQFTATYWVANLSAGQQEFHITVDVAEGFVFSGNRISSVRVPAGCIYRFWHTCLALGVGRCRLPRVRVLRGKGADQKLVRIAPTSGVEVGGGGGGDGGGATEEGIEMFVHPSKGLEAAAVGR